MIVVDEKLLNAFRRKECCEWCGRPWRIGLDPHHLFTRGMGGGSRLDVRVNLIALCRFCHDEVHAGRVQRLDLLAVVARREGVLQHEIEAEVYRLLRSPRK